MGRSFRPSGALPLSKPARPYGPNQDGRFALHQRQPRADKLDARQWAICQADPAYAEALRKRVSNEGRFAAFMAGVPTASLQPAVVPIEILVGLEQLRAAWSRTKAGKGGISALAGFEFQITQALLEIIRAEGAGGGLVLMEVLSDILRHDGGLVVSQLKRTLSSGALHKALEELWQIEQLARRITPELRPLLRYQVQAVQRDLQDVAGSLGRWAPTAVADALELAEFKKRVQASVVIDPRLEAARLLVEKFLDPTPFQTVDRFAGILLRAGDEKGLERASEEIQILLSGLRASAGERAVDFRIWGEADRAPLEPTLEADSRKAVRVGQRLVVADLVAGRLADRKAYKGLHADAEDWLAASVEGTDKVPTFWIEGRSGAGKSAALLHLLAKLHEEDPQRLIIWLGPRSDRFGEVLRRFRDAMEDGRRLIVAIDDPLAPDQQQAFIAASQSAADEWTRLSSTENASTPLPPCLICCGPTEQREYGEDNCYAELSITAYPLATESPEDIKELANWYRIRTGKNPPVIAGDVLLVQRFFEWDQGSIRDFALRFRRRLEGFGRAGPEVFDLVARILAFGRLYADYPATSLQLAVEQNSDVARAFDRLSEEEAHLTFRSDGDGVRMTHPHLADAIYQEWFGRAGDSRARKQHLEDGINAALGQIDQDPGVRLAPLWAIARLARGAETGRPAPPELRERLTLIEGEVQQLLPKIYQSISPSTAGPAELPVWLVLDQAFGLQLKPAPGDLLRSVLDASDQPRQGLRLSCHVLLASMRRGETDDPRRQVAGMLHRLVDWRDDEGLPWRDWAYVASDLVVRGGSCLIVDDVLRLIERAPKWASLRVPVTAIARMGAATEAVAVASAWLEVTQDFPHVWVGVLRAAHDRDLPVPKLGELSARFLLASPRHRSWPTIWKVTVESGLIDRSAIMALGLAWLGVKPEAGIPVAAFDADDYHKVLSTSIAVSGSEAGSELLDLGLAWLSQSHATTDGWSAVWSAVWCDGRLAGTGIDTVQKCGIAALNEFASNREWSFIWHGFVRCPRSVSTDAALDLGLDWLGRVSFRHSGWVFVWETLNDRLPTSDSRRVKLRELGRNWLAQANQHRGWTSVWAALRLDRCESPAAFLAIGQAWLAQTPPDHPGWRFVAHHVLRATPPSSSYAEQFAEVGYAWLKRHPNDRYWSQIFQDLTAFLTEEELDGFERDALDRSRRNGGPEPRLVKAILKRQKSASHKEALMTELARWLGDNFEHWDWPIGWTLLAASEEGPVSHEALLDIAAQWSEAYGPTSRGWAELWPSWYFLLRKLRPDELAAKASDALTCLLTISLTHSRWAQIWDSIRRINHQLLKEPEALERQRAWLIHPIRDANKWSMVFKEYRRNQPNWSSDPMLVERVENWLTVADGSETFWAIVWLAARSINPQDPSLHEIGGAWLRTQPKASSGWHLVWRFIAQEAAGETLSDLISLGDLWLAERDEDEPQWRRFKQVVEGVRHKSVLLESCDTSLQGEVRKDSDGQCLVKVPAGRFAVIPAKDGLKALVSTVESADIRDPEWVRGWSTLMSKLPRENISSTLGSRAVEWLSSSTTEETSWPWVWKDVWVRWPELRDPLQKIGRDWLRGRSGTTPGRYHVQKALFKPQVRRQNKTSKA